MDISNNELTSLPYFKGTRLKELLMKNNQFDCGCHLSGFHKFLSENGNIETNGEECATPEALKSKVTFHIVHIINWI